MESLLFPSIVQVIVDLFCYHKKKYKRNLRRFSFQIRCLSTFLHSSPPPPSILLVLQRKPLCPRLLLPWHCMRILTAKGNKGKILKTMLFPVGRQHCFSFHQWEQCASLMPAWTDVALELWVSNERGIACWTMLWKWPNVPALGTFSIHRIFHWDSFSELCFKVPGFGVYLFKYFFFLCELTLL